MDDLVRPISLILSIVGIAIAVYAVVIHRKTLKREHLAVEIDLIPAKETITILPEMTSVPTQFKLKNSIGSPQLVRDFWLRIVRYPSEFSDGQVRNFLRTLHLLYTTSEDVISHPVTQSKLMKTDEDRKFPWLMISLGFLLQIHDRIFKGKPYGTPSERFRDFALNMITDGLGDTIRLTDVENLSPDESRAVFELLTSYVNPFGALTQNESILITRSVNIDISPKSILQCEIDLTQFQMECNRALAIMGGTFRFTCLIEARLHGSEKRSESDLFDVEIDVPSLDLAPYATQARRKLLEQLDKEQETTT